jgi:UDP-2,3-diacylglucosamine hydrolase
MTENSGRLGIIAGGGQLPVAIAETARAQGRPVFVLALEGMADAALETFPHSWISLGELGRAIKLLKEHRCGEVTLAGKVARPEFSKLKLDARGALALPRVMAAAIKGDDALLRAVLHFFESEGMRVVGSVDAARDLIAARGPLGLLEPSEEEDSDIAHGMQVVSALGALDIGQAVVVCRGLVLAVEAAEGTDAMLTRVASLPAAIRGTPEDKMGVLVKAAKPNQERRVDLPVIGVRTVELAASAGLAGIAVEAGAALIVNRLGVIQAANHHSLFVTGVTPPGCKP